MNIDAINARYKEEGERQQALLAAFNVPLGLLVLLGGALALILKEFPYKDAPFGLSVWFLAHVTASFAVAARCGYCLFRSHVGYTYDQVPAPREWLDYATQLRNWYREVDPEHGAELAEADIEAGMIANYVSACDVNIANNVAKSAFLHKANQVLVVLIGAVLLNAAPYVIAIATAPDKIYKVEVTSTSCATVRVK